MNEVCLSNFRSVVVTKYCIHMKLKYKTNLLDYVNPFSANFVRLLMKSGRSSVTYFVLVISSVKEYSKQYYVVSLAQCFFFYLFKATCSGLDIDHNQIEKHSY